MFEKPWFIILVLCIGFVVANASAVNDNEKTHLLKLTPDNFVVIRGPITGKLASEVISTMIGKETDDLYVYITTPGGEVSAGSQITQTIQALKASGVKVKCIADVAMSMGFVIAQHCSERFVTSSSVMMQHQMSLGSSGSLYNVNSYMGFINTIDDEFDEFQAARIGITPVEFENKIAHDWWITGAMAVKEGVADKLVNVICDFKHEAVNTTVNTIFGQLTVVYSNCPLARDPIDIIFDNEAITYQQKADILNDYSISNQIKAFVTRK